MKLTEFDLGQRRSRRVPSPGRCIYCGIAGKPLTDEHVVPFALGANSLVLEKSCCSDCQKIIQKYEQEVLKKQLGVFRAQVDAPTRNRKDRATDVPMHFVEVNEQGKPMRDLGRRRIALAEAPLMICLWSSPLPELLDPKGAGSVPLGQPWTYVDQQAMAVMVKQVAEETGAKHVAAKIGEVNRRHYLRSLAKTAHAYAAAEMGLDAFDPMLVDLILCRRDDVETFVGDLPHESPFDADDSHTFQIAIGEPLDGPGAGYLVARIVLYPTLGSPAHVVILGRVR
ncbi:hypothetical protein [Mesorhizobium sp.]|uniref:hypothetical protein n=1 Tax=Mesorhizobium sp. TaxID=1871066 RepID=UPI000FE75C85|nr:hypothetical protein [Mesorhizobium sp.]RWA68003.1 MAG: hypothetical protein EOQ29_21425 [Mesorhizobium sp.]